MMKPTVYFLCLVTTACQLFSSPDAAAFHPGARLDVDALRHVLEDVADQREIRMALGEVTDWRQLPFYLDEWYPDEWPNQVISSTPTNAFATLGPWKIYFGRRSSETVIPAVNAHMPQCAVYEKAEYLARNTLSCTRLVLDIRPDTIGYDPQRIRIRGWYIQVFTAKDYGTKIVAEAVKYTAAGGECSSFKWIGAGDISTAIVEPAFRGYVMRAVSAPHGQPKQ